MNYARKGGRKVAIVEPPEAQWTANLEEDLVDGGQSWASKQTPVFHGYSMTGNVKGPLVYANHGSKKDYVTLEGLGINVNGAIVLVRSGGQPAESALKVKMAELSGAAGCLIFSDPVKPGDGGSSWSKSQYLPKDGVERDTVGLTSWVVGDVLTPGWASTKAAPRNSMKENPGLVKIPSMPLSARDAETLLRALKGHGKRAPDDWIGGIIELDEWWTGDRHPVVVQLVNEQDEVEKRPIWNVFGAIGGLEQSEKTVIIGAHRDSWCLGAADGGSGTSVLLEVAAIFGKLARLGWRPRRTIQFASWDASEHNLIGSTEWVEENLAGLRLNGVAYLNLGAAIAGPDLVISASPLFQSALETVLDRVTDPVTRNKTLTNIWRESKRGGSELKSLRADGDYVPFQHLAGTSSIGMGFQGQPYPKQSCYDTIGHMKAFGDPNFTFHSLLAEVWALLLFEIAEQPVLPFDFVAYATKVKAVVQKLKEDLSKGGLSAEDAGRLNLKPLDEAVERFLEDAKNFQGWKGEWDDMIENSGGIESEVLAIQRMSHNNRMSNFETHLLDLEGGGGVSAACLMISRYESLADGFFLRRYPDAISLNILSMDLRPGLTPIEPSFRPSVMPLLMATSRQLKSKSTRPRPY